MSAAVETHYLAHYFLFIIICIYHIYILIITTNFNVLSILKIKLYI